MTVHPRQIQPGSDYPDSSTRGCYNPGQYNPCQQNLGHYIPLQFIPKPASLTSYAGLSLVMSLVSLFSNSCSYENDAMTHGSMGTKTIVELIDAGATIKAKASEWATPLFVYHSDQDQLTDFETSRDFAALARAEFHSFSGVEHEMHNDTSRTAVYALVDGFIDRIAGRD